MLGGYKERDGLWGGYRIEIGKRRRDRSLILNTQSQMVSAVFLKKFQVKIRLYMKPKYIELIYCKLFTLKKQMH